MSTGRLSLAALAGTDWVLRAWDITEPAAEEPVVTLAYDAGRFAGTSGCNRYTGGVNEGTAPGELSVGLLAGTRMACPDAQASVESRFLEQLSGARTFGFRLGRSDDLVRKGERFARHDVVRSEEPAQMNRIKLSNAKRRALHCEQRQKRASESR